jgi:hypothetical protein
VLPRAPQQRRHPCRRQQLLHPIPPFPLFSLLTFSLPLSTLSISAFQRFSFCLQFSAFLSRFPLSVFSISAFQLLPFQLFSSASSGSRHANIIAQKENARMDAGVENTWKTDGKLWKRSGKSWKVVETSVF